MDRDELTDLMVLLQEEVKAGRLEIRSPDTLRAFAAVRFDHEGKVDPSTVSSYVRAAALAAAAGRTRRIREQTSLREVQQRYFDLLDHFFGGPFSEMRRHRLDPQTVAGHGVQRQTSERFRIGSR
jgi:hypothetical protein